MNFDPEFQVKSSARSDEIGLEADTPLSLATLPTQKKTRERESKRREKEKCENDCERDKETKEKKKGERVR